jgi:HlyD family secretion protein
VDVAAVTQGTLSITLDDDGRTRVRNRYVVSAPISGRVLRMGLSPGDEIREGQALATLVPIQTPLLDGRTMAEAEARAHGAGAAVKRAIASVEGARTALELAKTDASRATALAGEGAIPKADLDRATGAVRLREADLSTAEFTLQVARHDEALANVVLGRTKPTDKTKAESITVTAPAGGRVLRVFQESEGVVAPGTPLLEIGDPSNLEIVVDVLTSDAIRVRERQSAAIHRWGGATLGAHVRRIEPSALTKVSALGVEEQRVNVLLDLDDPPAQWSALGDGYRVEVAITIETFADVTLVPIGALFRKGSATATFVIDAEGFARERSLEVLGQGEREAAVASGLAPGDQVVLHPSDRIKDGARVEARQ